MKLQKYCSNKSITFDEDILSDTVLRVAEKILAKGIADPTTNGFENFFFMSFKNNIMRERQYARNAKRVEVSDIWSAVKDVSGEDTINKIELDVQKDFSAVYLLKKVESKYGPAFAHLFTQKYFLGETYKEMRQKHPDIPKLREKLLEAKKWLQETTTKEEIRNALDEYLSF